jgi:acetylglutamate/LysW-gamma-L-alpha-aminoadipate kinase
VLSVPIIDENHVAINSENDDIVNVLQEALEADTIIQLIEAPGFLDAKDDPTTLVPRITKQELAAREQLAEGRMKRKMLALTKLFESGAGTVIIADGRTEHPVRDALDGKGTIIR